MSKTKNIILPLLFGANINSIIESNPKRTFAYDLDFLKKHKKTIILKNNDGRCQVILIPDFQARVMTSTSNGINGKSYGWINYDLIASKKFKAHINVVGGEDRFWLGPEAGQFAIFFEKGTDFTLENWHTPKPIDTEPFTLLHHSDTGAFFEKKMQLTNYHGFEFDVEIKRKISILDKDYISRNLNIGLDGQVSYVGFQSENILTNIGAAWSRGTGLLSIWILGMFIPSDNTTVIIPFKNSLELNTRYFGEIGADRLSVINNAVLFKGDGKYRCKIGLPPQNALPFFGSYDGINKVLTIVEYTFKGDTTYVNSLWEHQANPYGGDVINSYNDGPLNNGEQLGPFYELESSSSSKELQHNETMTHIHKTYHFEGKPEALNTIAKKVLNFDLNELRKPKKLLALPKNQKNEIKSNRRNYH